MTDSVKTPTKATEASDKKAEIGVTGLAVMGSNLARNFASKGFVTAVHNRSSSKTEALIKDHGSDGDFIASESAADFVASLATPRKIIIMVKAGDPTDAVIDELSQLLEPGDILVDGGNSKFEDTRRREEAAREKGIHFVGSGISGGEEGALLGPSIMPGGSVEAYQSLGPILEKISAHVDGVPCCTHIGTDGAGHFVKMIHNGIEYADMQLIAEAYDLLRHGAELSPAEIADVFADWNTGELESFLVEITAEVLKQVDAESGKPLVDVILDAAGQKGTGTWTVQTALNLGVPVSGIAEAVFARGLSSAAAQRAAAQKVELPGPETTWQVKDKDVFIEDVRLALYASKIVAYAQGFDVIAAGAKEYGWDIDNGALARIWRGGCIIRAAFLNRITEAFESDPGLLSLLFTPYFTEVMTRAQGSWRAVVSGSAQSGIPTPGFSSSLAYYDGLRAQRLPASVIQGQRDFFGAHTYKRIDKEGTFHTLWSADRSEVEA